MAPSDRCAGHGNDKNKSASCLYLISCMHSHYWQARGQEFNTYGYWDGIARACQRRCSGDTHEQRAMQNRMKHTDATDPAMEPREHLSVYVEQIGGKAKAHAGT